MADQLLRRARRALDQLGTHARYRLALWRLRHRPYVHIGPGILRLAGPLEVGILVIAPDAIVNANGWPILFSQLHLYGEIRNESCLWEAERSRRTGRTEMVAFSGRLHVSEDTSWGTRVSIDRSRDG